MPGYHFGNQCRDVVHLRQGLGVHAHTQPTPLFDQRQIDRGDFRNQIFRHRLDKEFRAGARQLALERLESGTVSVLPLVKTLGALGEAFQRLDLRYLRIRLVLEVVA